MMTSFGLLPNYFYLHLTSYSNWISVILDPASTYLDLLEAYTAVNYKCKFVSQVFLAYRNLPIEQRGPLATQSVNITQSGKELEKG